MTIGKAMRRARKRAKLTLEKLGEMSGYNFTTICQYELDRIVPSLITVTDLADALGLSIDEYIGHTVKRRKRATTLEYIEVVRCKDCKHCMIAWENGNENRKFRICKVSNNFVSDTHFCGYGARKEGANNA